MKSVKKGVAFYGWIAVLVVFVAVAAYAWYVQLSGGLIVTDMRDVVMWGLYITNYSFFVGLSAGSLIISAVAYVFDVERYKQVSRIAVVVATICGALAMTFVMVDLGHPERAVVEMILTPNPASMFVYDFITLSLYLLVCIVYGWTVIRGKGDELTAKALAAIAILVAILAVGVSSWVFGFVKARPMWFSALLAPLFISSALVSGIALVIFTAILASSFTKIKVEPTLLSDLGKILAVLILIDLFLLLSETVTAWYAEIPSHVETASLLLTGSYSPLFWGEVVVGAFIPFLVLAYPRTRKSISVLTVASVLVMVGVFVKKFNLIVPGLTLQTLGTLGATSPLGELLGTYSPTWVEWAIVAGLYALGMLLFTVSTKLLPLGMSTEKKVGGM